MGEPQTCIMDECLTGTIHPWQARSAPQHRGCRVRVGNGLHRRIGTIVGLITVTSSSEGTSRQAMSSSKYALVP